MNRRSFMSAILATATAPAIVRAGSIMRVNPRIVRPPYVVVRKFVGGAMGGSWDYPGNWCSIYIPRDEWSGHD